MPRMTPAERALIRRALPNFVNFMRFLHPGPACAAKFASSTAELGWDGSLLHCKRRGQVVPSFRSRLGQNMCVSAEPFGWLARETQAIALCLRFNFMVRCGFDVRMSANVTGLRQERKNSAAGTRRSAGAVTAPTGAAGASAPEPRSRLPDAAGVHRVHRLALGAAKGLAELVEVLHRCR